MPNRDPIRREPTPPRVAQGSVAMASLAERVDISEQFADDLATRGPAHAMSLVVLQTAFGRSGGQGFIAGISRKDSPVYCETAHHYSFAAEIASESLSDHTQPISPSLCLSTGAARCRASQRISVSSTAPYCNANCLCWPTGQRN